MFIQLLQRLFKYYLSVIGQHYLRDPMCIFMHMLAEKCNNISISSVVFKLLNYGATCYVVLETNF